MDTAFRSTLALPGWGGENAGGVTCLTLIITEKAKKVCISPKYLKKDVVIRGLA